MEPIVGKSKARWAGVALDRYLPWPSMVGFNQSPSTWALTHSIPSPQSLWWPFQKVVVYLKRESSGSLFKWYHLTQGQAPGGHFQTAIDYLSDTQSIDQQTFSFFFFFFFFYNVLIKLPLSGQIQPNQKSTSKLLCAHMMLVSATMD